MDTERNTREKLILASGSPRRRTLCEEAGYVLEIHIPEVTEIHHDDDPEQTVRENAELKFSAVAGEYPGRIVIAADTVLEFEGQCIGKPCNENEARRIWAMLSGKRHRVLTAVACGRDLAVIDVVESGVLFRVLTEEDMDRYLLAVDPMDKAGGYNIDEPVKPGLVEAYDGSYSNIMGLPMGYLEKRLKALTTRSSP